ncbi:MAG: transketolase [Deltaproteobacteria bacterium]|nr:transketolase [Deltaproteobacteria bacterium]
MRDAFVRQLSVLADSNPRIMLITGDLGFGVLTDFAKRFPKQYLNVGVAEQNMTGVATGLALEGRIIFTYSIGNFPTLRTLEQLRNGPCYHNLNVNVVSIGGGFSYGQLGFSHHATEDLAIMRSLPNTTVVAPCDTWEVVEATTALVQKEGVGYLRIDKSQASTSTASPQNFSLGKARVLREGGDLTFISCGGILEEVLQAATMLAARGMESRVISMHTISQIDVDELRAATSGGAPVFTVEEHVLPGGLGSAVAEVLVDRGIAPRIFYRFAIRGGFCSVVGEQKFLRRTCQLDGASIVEKVSALLGAASS